MSAQPKTQLTEAAIQDLLYFHCTSKGHILVNPNSCVFGWESDFISVTKTLMVHEFEIKISKSDFRADADKEKHATLLNPVKTIYPEYPSLRRDITLHRPNYFYYVCPDYVAGPADMPDHAALIHVVPWGNRWMLKPVTRIRRIHNEPIEQKRLIQLSRSLMYRYWRQRLNTIQLPTELK